jgi:hypothetical protein
MSIPYLLDKSRVLRAYCGFAVLFCTLLLILSGASAATAAAEKKDAIYPPYRFAPSYGIEEVFSNRTKADAFITEYLTREGEFFSIARHRRTGLSYDGYDLDERTGKPEKPRLFSAPSKECLDVALCVKALAGNTRAALVVSPRDPSRAREVACEILKRKMSGYEAYLKANPGYAGYLPWYVSDDVVSPTPDWKDEFPGLDNGEWLWTMLVAERVIERQGYVDLAKRYRDYNTMIKNKVVSIFYDEKAGKVRGDIRIVPSFNQGFTYEHAPHKSTFLTGEHGVHEGMMMILYVCLFGKDLPPDATSRIWSDIAMKRVETEYGTTWEGWYASSHEEWAYLVLPMRDMPEYRTLFRIREKIRTQNARQRGYPGFATSCLVSRKEYIDKAGIEGIVSQSVRNNHTFALYGAFPLLLECSDERERVDGNYGLAWLLNMLKGDRMQGPLGAGESGSNDGTRVADVKTIDGSFTIDLALCGGLDEETAEMLKAAHCYDRFREILLGEYDESFKSLPLREPVNFALPGTSVPKGKLGDYLRK